MLEREMGSGEGSLHWSVFDNVKTIPTTPEALMAEINSAISSYEYARATALLESPPSSHLKNKSPDLNLVSQYDAQMADEAYKEGLASLAAGKLNEALYSLNVSLSKCPPDKASAVAKLQSLISLTSQQLKKPQSGYNVQRREKRAKLQCFRRYGNYLVVSYSPRTIDCKIDRATLLCTIDC